ncbi:MAG: ABC transporter permease [Chloroflexi bacterium]|nr:MAG: ABC transporter permease [Chloroflexota bacterium]
MKRVWRFVSRLHDLLASHRSERDFNQEVELHLSLLIEKFIRDGMSPEDARNAARRQFGNVTSLSEIHREMRSFGGVQAFFRDLRHGARVLQKTPAWTAVAVLTLTLGIGANIAIFSVIQAVLLKPLPYPDPARLVVPCTIFQRLNTDRGNDSFADILDWKAERDLFESVAALIPGSTDLTDGGEPDRVRALLVDDAYFQVMGAPPLLGRFFTAAENLPSAPPVVVLGRNLWMRRYGGDPGVIGRRIEVRGAPATIVGVAQADSTWPSEGEIFQPLGTGGQPDADMLRRDNHEYLALARLARGVSIEQAQARLTVMGARIAERESTRKGTNWKLHSLAAYVIGPTLRQTLIVLFGAVVLVLLIACVNVANLLLARGAAREREVSIRAALGAGRGRIATQFLAESVLLSVAGGAAGIVAGFWGLRALILLAPSDIPRLEQAHVDVRVLAFSVGLCLVAALIAGVAPAWQAARVAPLQSFHEAGRSVSAGFRANRVRSLLVVTELALALVVLIGAGLLIHSVARIAKVEPGIAAHNVLTMGLSLPDSRYARGPQVADGFERVLSAVRRVPGVIAASATSALPLGGGGFYLGRVFLRDGQPEPPASADTAAAWSVVQPGYFATVGIPILQGRPFTNDDGANSTPVIIVSQSMARAMFPDGRVLGRRMRSWRDENVYREIVGVVGDVRHYGLTEDATNTVYVPHTQNAWRSLTLVVRTGPDPATVLNRVRDAIWTVDRKLPVADVRTLEQVIDRNMARSRFSMFLLILFGGAAVVLAAIGIYGMIAYAVAQRTREIGIRMALGADRRTVVAMVARNAAALAGAGIVCGVGAALALTRLLQSMLYEVSATDAASFGGAVLLLLALGSAAACVPAWRASRIDPVSTLRYE